MAEVSVGFVGSRSIAGVATEFMALGPIPAGYVLDRIDFLISGAGEVTPQVLVIGVCLSKSASENQLTFEAGQQLISQSDNVIFGKPVIAFNFTAGGQARFVMYPGIVVEGGSTWVLLAISNVSAAVASVTNVSLRVRRAE